MEESLNMEGQLKLVETRGYSAYEVAVQNGFVGTEEEWLASLVGPVGPQGKDGKSSYEVAVDNGYEGTEEEWLSEFLTPEGYILKEDIVDNLESDSNQKPLSAKQGKQLKEMIDNTYDKSFVDESITELNENIANKIDSIDVKNTYTTKQEHEVDISSLNSRISGLASGSPTPVSSTSAMTDTSKVYVNTTDGNWYYYNGTSWVSGGVYQSTGLDLDTTLTNSSKASNSKSVGDYTSQNRANIQINSDRVKNYDGIITVTDLMIGRITYSQANGFSWIHDDAGKNCVSTPDNVEYHLQQSDIVSLKDYDTYRFKIIHRDMNGTYKYSDWRSYDYIVPEEGYYIFSMQRINGTVLTNAVELSEQFYIKTHSYEEDSFRSMSLSAEEYIKSKLVNGNMDTRNGLYEQRTNRATFYGFIKLNKNISIVNVDRTYSVNAYLLDEENKITTKSIVRGNIIIPANTNFKIVLRKATETSGEIISVSDLANSIKIYEEETREVSNIFDERHLEAGYLDASGNMVDSNNTKEYPVTSTDYYEIGDEKLISLQIFNSGDNVTTDWYCLVYYDENKNVLGRYSLYPLETNIKHLVGLLPTAKYFRVSYRHWFYAKIMINYGYNFTEYKHYPIKETGRKMYNISDYGIFGVAHAGGGVAPENTLPAFKLAKQRGFNFCECDIQFTSDNVPVLMHDATVDRTTDGSGRVRQMTLEQIKALDASHGMDGYAGVKVPTFEEFIVLCKDIKLMPSIELKMDDITVSENYSMISIIYDIIKKYNMQDRVMFTSVSYTKLLTVRMIDPYAILIHTTFNEQYLMETIYRTDGILRTPTNQVRCSINRGYLQNDETYINKCKELNIPIDAWTCYADSQMTTINKYVSGVYSETNKPYEKFVYDNTISQ